MEQFSILILDDDSRIRNEIVEYLSGMNYKCFPADRPSAAQNILDNNQIDLMIADINLPEKDGLVYLKELKEKYHSLEVIIITGYADVSRAVEALRLGAIDFLNKPFRLVDIENAILKTKRFFELSTSVKLATDTIELINTELKKDLEINFIGNSDTSRKMAQDINRVAQSPDTTVLITGESGTGKELVARSIHQLSDRAKHPFIAVNSSAIPESLFESELFGFKKGAFTGAIDSKAGCFELANKGTLFFDEISEMNISMQAKLLRVIEDRKIRRIGSDSEINIDVRIISASNQNFSDMIAQNKFRNDLYYRLAVFEINLPPLRERKDDIPLLLEYYVKYFSNKMNKKITRIDNSVFGILTDYPFPGNIRELKNIIERAVIMCSGNTVNAELFENCNKKNHELSVSGEENYDLEQNEKELILKVLEKTDNNKSQAAKLLNITWQSLDRRLIKYNIECGDKRS